jgi:hypothetical protein
MVRSIKSIKSIRNIKKVIFGIIITALSTLGFAQSGIVEIANFYCPHCYAAQKYTQEIRQSLEKKGDLFQFVPWFTDSKSQQAAMIYLSADKAIQDKLRLGLFTAANAGSDFSTGFKGCTSIHMFMPEYSVKTCTASLMNNQAIHALKKTMKLLKMAYNGQLSNLKLPIFIVIKDNHVIGKMSYADTDNVSELVINVKTMLGG